MLIFPCEQKMQVSIHHFHYFGFCGAGTPQSHGSQFAIIFIYYSNPIPRALHHSLIPFCLHQTSLVSFFLPKMSSSSPRLLPRWNPLQRLSLFLSLSASLTLQASFRYLPTFRLTLSASPSLTLHHQFLICLSLCICITLTFPSPFSNSLPTRTHFLPSLSPLCVGLALSLALSASL